MDLFVELDDLVIDLLIKGALLLLVVRLILLALRRASSATRHAGWVLAFCGLLLLPIGDMLFINPGAAGKACISRKPVCV